MDPLFVVENTPFSMSVVSPVDESILYTITSHRDLDGTWVDVVYRTERGAGTPSKCSIPTELATVSYIDSGTTRVTFCRSMKALGEQQPDGGLEVGLDTFLKQRNPYSNSRIFIGPGGATYKWRVDGEKLKLYDTTTRTLVARFQPRRSKLSFYSWLPWINKCTKATATERAARLLHPILSFHPILESDTPQLHDAIVLTFVIMKRLLKERMQYLSSWWLAADLD